MAESVSLTGTLIAGPGTVTESSFPGGVTNIPIALTPPAKSFNVDSGGTRSVSSPSAYVALTGVGVADTVTQGKFLYLRTSTPMLVRLTTVNPPGADVVSVVPVQGLLVLEFDPAKYLKLLEVQGSGVVEWFVCGEQ